MEGCCFHLSNNEVKAAGIDFKWWHCISHLLLQLPVDSVSFFYVNHHGLRL